MKKKGGHVKIRHLIAVLLMLAALPTLTLGATYKWVDEKGGVHFSDTPPAEGAQAHSIEGNLNIVDAQTGSSSAYSRGDRPAKGKAMKADVELFVTSWCPYCKKALAFFRSRGISVRSYDVERDKRAARRKRQLDRHRGVPFALVNGVPIHGYNEAAYRQALEKR